MTLTYLANIDEFQISVLPSTKFWNYHQN